MISKKHFGEIPNIGSVTLYKILAQNGAYVELLDFGATLQAMVVPDKNGNFADIVQGFDDLEGHLNHSDFQGKTVGRYANRIGGGGFFIDGKITPLPADENGVFLHSGGEFSDALWRGETVGEDAVKFTHTSDGKGFGYSGTVAAAVLYRFDGRALTIDYTAAVSASTVLNFTNHTYWNLRGEGTILEHILEIEGDFFQPVDELMLPNAQPENVTDTPFDFRQAKPIGRDINADDPQLKIARGYDHHFYLNKNGAVKVTEPETGRILTMTTDKPGFQLYTGNFLSGAKGKSGVPLGVNTGFCLESQFPPNTPNSPNLAQCMFSPREEYRSRTVYEVGCL